MEKSVYIEETMLQDMVPESKCALSLDCWSSVTQLSFMGVICSFIDKFWTLQEVLIGFEPIHTSHSGEELCTILGKVIDKHQLHGRIVLITTNNASNNLTMMKAVDIMLSTLEEDGNNFIGSSVQHISCLAHVIQLALGALLGHIRIQPTNEQLQMYWEEDEQLKSLDKLSNSRGVAFTLGKVCIIF